jgi:hypothetical protein
MEIKYETEFGPKAGQTKNLNYHEVFVDHDIKFRILTRIDML